MTCRLAVAALTLLVALPLSAAWQSSAPYLSVKALLDKTSQYVAGYQRDFAFLVADEHVEQRTNQPAPGSSVPCTAMPGCCAATLPM